MEFIEQTLTLVLPAPFLTAKNSPGLLAVSIDTTQNPEAVFVSPGTTRAVAQV